MGCKQSATEKCYLDRLGESIDQGR